MQGRTVDEATLDVTQCDREPIHIPGAIQPHGVLFALDAATRRIVQISANAESVIGRDADVLLHERLDTLLGEDVMTRLERAAGGPDEGSVVFTEISVNGEVRGFELVAYRSEGVLVIELERAAPPNVEAIDRYAAELRRAIAHVQNAETLADVVATACAEFARIAGFDRTMVYRFDRDWHGEVVAETLNDTALTPFFGLHYPASDIPRQARELYQRNALRLIPDTRSAPVPLLPERNPLTDAPLDLSRSVLRSVSPMHLQYLANMGVAASMSAALLKHGELWGLFSVHHGSARFVPYRTRVACELLARTTSLQITALEDREEADVRLRLRALQPRLIEAAANEGNALQALAHSPALLGIADAEGAVIAAGAQPILVGTTPRLPHVRRILAWLAERNGGAQPEPFITDELGLINPEFAECRATASGVLAVPLTSVEGGWIIWFRPEQERTVTWGGDPRKALEADGSLSPRTSFAAWKESVQMRARPWDAVHLDAAIELQRLLSDALMRRARDFERKNVELSRSNEELESFAHTASHDLKEPLRGINTYATILAEDYGGAIDERGREMLGNVRDLVTRMEAQIASMLELARISAVHKTPRPLSLDVALDEALALLAPRIVEEGAEIVRPETLPVAMMNAVRAREIFVNLIGNALKYRRPGVAPRIVIETRPGGFAPARARGPADDPDVPSVTVVVRDNGIGIREKNFESIFRMFKRLHPPGAYGGGTGAGLAIARRIVQLNGGSLWVESTAGETSFLFTVPTSEA
jgi:light-regulated signal transduction histidine kinase (bacteriophytochrome)